MTIKRCSGINRPRKRALGPFSRRTTPDWWVVGIGSGRGVIGRLGPAAVTSQNGRALVTGRTPRVAPATLQHASRSCQRRCLPSCHLVNVASMTTTDQPSPPEPAAARLAAYLEHWAETQSSFAARANLDRHTLNHIVKGRRQPTLTQAFDIERATGGVIPASAWIRPLADT